MVVSLLIYRNSGKIQDGTRSSLLRRAKQQLKRHMDALIDEIDCYRDREADFINISQDDGTE
jgi:hypothetical protein